jgi:uncharacterized protein YceH (UPF0502 family)
LIEKQITTPEYYPLSLNALTNACNQKSNRDPVVSFDEETVLEATDGLREKKLAWVIKKADSRVLKYGHIFPEAFHLSPPEVAAMCVLMLRGPCTPGEIRASGSRLFNFDGLPQVEAALQTLMQNDQGALIAKLPRQAGHKEARYAHLLAGDVQMEESEPSMERAAVSPTGESASARMTRLEEEVEALKQVISELRQELSDFKKQFE